MKTTVLGYPRIGPNRELKRAVEGYWKTQSEGRGTDTAAAELAATARKLRADTWWQLADAGLDAVPSNTFSYYDQVLDTAVMLGAVPERFASLGLNQLDTMFAMARGTADAPAMEMSKWFDTNYHYLVPELGPGTQFGLGGGTPKPVAEFTEAREHGVDTRPVLVGPLTFLLLAKPADGTDPQFDPLELLDGLVEAYVDLLGQLADAGASWVQFDEPVLVTDLTEEQLAAVRRAYARLGGLDRRPSILVAGYYGDMGQALPVLAETPVEGLALDLVAGETPSEQGLAALAGKTVVAGVVDGRNVWRTDLDAALATVNALAEGGVQVAVGSSCPLLHVPYDVEAETELNPQVRGWLAFARQKVGEIVLLGRAREEGSDAVSEGLAAARVAITDRRNSPLRVNPAVRERTAALTDDDARREPYAERAELQRKALDLPPLPTTTIGSFPQTSEIRTARAAHRRGEIDEATYRQQMRAEIAEVVRLQESLGLDVLVHGEPERNDMVQYFGEQLDGFVFTQTGWVQSYGSRCVRPPILYGDVSRPAPMTVEWASYAQSLTDKPMKGMLTGPVTILAWSFVRDDQPLGDTAAQVALAIRDEVTDLEAAGINIIQVDEAALRELLPLAERDRPAYRDWAVRSFRLATSGASASTQVHTHMCYSEFADIYDMIQALDADVTSIEAARSRMEIVDDLHRRGFERGVGPGVYDIHSPRVPDADEVEQLLTRALDGVGADRLWVNPDCGLKTRAYAEIEPSLDHLVAATRKVRAALA